jgi:hypothetical protein
MKELCEIQKCNMYTSLERPSSCFRLIVGTTNTEQAKIYENTCKWLLRVVQTKLGSTMFDYAKLMTSDDQIDVRIIIGMSRSSYVKHFETTMNSTEIKNELDDTIREIKIRCARALQKLHEHIGDQVKPPVQDDDRIQVSWLDD